MKKEYATPCSKTLSVGSRYGLLDETMSYTKDTVSDESDIGFSKQHDVDDEDYAVRGSVWDD